MSLANRPTSLRDPANPDGGIFIANSNSQVTNPPAQGTGSVWFSANIDGQWFVVNARGVKQSGTVYLTEQLAANAAAGLNGQANPDLEVDR